MRVLAAAILAFVASSSPCRAMADAFPADPARARGVEFVRSRLASADPREVAWGAYLAAEGRFSEAVPLVVARLREQARLPSEERSFLLCAALLDALVSTDADVEDGDLLAHAGGRHANAVLLLVVRHVERHLYAARTLFGAWFPRSLEWMAVGNALARARAPGFAAALLPRLDVRVSVRVWTELPRGVSPPPWGSISPGLRSRPIPEGWPPNVVYALAAHAGRGYALLSEGPASVYVRRVVSADEEAIGLEPDPDLSPVGAILGWLDFWVARAPGLNAGEEIDVRWTGPQPLLREVARVRDPLVAAWRETVERLVIGGLLTLDEVVLLPPPVRVVIDDRRSSARQALPEIPPPALPQGWLRSLRRSRS